MSALMERSVLLQPSKGTALLGGLTIFAALAIPLVATYSEYQREEALRLGAGGGYRAAIALLILLIAVAPILAFVGVLRTTGVCLSPTEIAVGRRRIAWKDISEATWEGRNGIYWLVLHSTDGKTVKLQPSGYEDDRERVLALMQEYMAKYSKLTLTLIR